MAVVFVFRLAIAITPVVVRACKTNGCDANAFGNAAARFYGDLIDPATDPDALSSEMSSSLGAEGGEIVVTDFTGTFELRKLHVRWSRSPSGGLVEDQDTCTFHFIKATGGTPGTYSDATDCGAVETAFGTYWGSIKAEYPTWLHLDQYRWYKDGPAFYVLNDGGTAYVPIGDNPAIRVTEVDVAGTSSDTAFLPPQTSMTVTEKTSSRRHWGRWYLPAPTWGDLTADGRISATKLGVFNAAAETLYNACRTAHMVPVVWSIQKPERPKRPSGTLPPWPATAFEVTSLTMDNLFDVMRSRRYSAPTGRDTRTLV